MHAHVPAGTGIRLDVELEDGGSRSVPQVDRWVEDRVLGTAPPSARRPSCSPPTCRSGGTGSSRHVDAPALDPGTLTSTLVVTPERLELPEPVASRRVVGLMAQLYQVRSAGSWGVGDLRDLADLATWAAAAHDADFLLVNPLHAAEPVAPMEPSPYLPTTRRFVNPMYLRVDDIPEVHGLDPSGHRRMQEIAARGRRLDEGDRIDRDAAWALKREALQLVHDVGLGTARSADLAAYCEREGEGLLRFATWCALAESLGLPFTEWPERFQDPGSEAVDAFQESERDAVDFHRWLQWLLEQQLASAQRDAQVAGMSLGIVHDLAVGVHPVGRRRLGARRHPGARA